MVRLFSFVLVCVIAGLPLPASGARAAGRLDDATILAIYDQANTADILTGPGAKLTPLPGLAAERIADWLPGLPVAVRRYAQADVYRLLHETGPGPYKADAVAAALSEVGAALGAQTSAALQHAAQ